MRLSLASGLKLSQEIIRARTCDDFTLPWNRFETFSVIGWGPEKEMVELGKGPKPEKSDFCFSLKQRGAINTKGSKNLPCHQEMSGQ